MRVEVTKTDGTKIMLNCVDIHSLTETKKGYTEMVYTNAYSYRIQTLRVKENIAEIKHNMRMNM